MSISYLLPITVIIPKDAAVSDPIDLTAFTTKALGLEIQVAVNSAWTEAGLSIEFSFDGDQYFPMGIKRGNPVPVLSAVQSFSGIPNTATHIRFVSRDFDTGALVPQSQKRTFTFFVRPTSGYVVLGEDDVVIDNTAPTISNATFNVSESATVSTVVGTPTASDENETDTLTYSIISGNTGNVFAINSSTGQITVNGALDYETTTTYNLVVQVQDDNSVEGESGVLSDTATITVNINEVIVAQPLRYGTAYTQRSLTNTQLKSGRVGDFRFVVKSDLVADGGTVYVDNGTFYHKNDGTGGPTSYWDGTGGLPRIRIFPDNGFGLPDTTTALETWTLASPLSAANLFPELVPSGTLALTVGQTYHMVVDNIDGDPNTNFTSINTGNLDVAPPVVDPDTDYAFLRALSGGIGNLAYVDNRPPIFAIKYTNGEAVGRSLIDANANTAGGSSVVQNRFTPSEDLVDITEIWVSVVTDTGSGGLTVELIDITDSNNVLESDTIPFASWDNTWTRWNKIDISARTLSSGNEYAVRVSAPSGTTYDVRNVRKGTNNDAAAWTTYLEFPDLEDVQYGSVGSLTTRTGWLMPFYLSNGVA